MVTVIAAPKETPNTKIIQKPASVGLDDILSLKTNSIENVTSTAINVPMSGYLCPLVFSTDITASFFSIIMPLISRGYKFTFFKTVVHFLLAGERPTVCVTRAGAGSGTPSDWKNAEA